MAKVSTNTTTGIYHTGWRDRLSTAFTVETINAVMDESSRGERFFVSSTDIDMN